MTFLELLQKKFFPKQYREKQAQKKAELEKLQSQQDQDKGEGFSDGPSSSGQ